MARQSPWSVTPRKPPTDRRTGESNTGRGQLPINHAIGPTTARNPLLPAGGGPDPQRASRAQTEEALQTSHMATAFSLPHPSWAPGAQLCPPALWSFPGHLLAPPKISPALLFGGTVGGCGERAL